MKNLYLHRRFFILLLGGVFAFLLAYLFPLLYRSVTILLGLTGLAVVTDMILLYGLKASVKAERSLNEKFSNGEENPVGVRVENRYPFKVCLRVIDEIPEQFQRRDLVIRRWVDAGGSLDWRYTLRPVRRGEYVFGQVRVFVASRLSLLERRYSFDIRQKVAVYPSFMAMKKYELLAFTGRQHGSGSRKIQTAGISMAFEQIKPYVQGDDPRTVNWKATAKCNRLMVNSYTEERSQQVYCVIDKGRGMHSPFHGMTILDYAINASLVLSNIILKKGDKAGLLTFAHSGSTLVKADNRRSQLGNISEALYNQRTLFLESDFERLCVTVARQIPNRSLLVLFTNFDTVHGLRLHLPALHRLADAHLLLVILFENSKLEQVVQRKVKNTQEIYLKSIAGSLLLEKKQICQELQKAGIAAMLTRPEELTVNTINAYLELKERGRI